MHNKTIFFSAPENPDGFADILTLPSEDVCTMHCFRGAVLILAIAVACSAGVQARHSYDYIVVGGGTAGCVAAARLSENPYHRVLLISNGEDQTGRIENQLPLINPIVSPVPTDYIRFADVLMSTEDVTYGASGRKSSIALRPRLLGGGSSVNGGAFIRPDNSDYIRLHDDYGVNHWSVPEIDQIWKRIETFHPETGVANPGHGTTGPIHTRAISPDQILSWYAGSLQNATGTTFNPDMGLGNVAGSGYTVRPLGGPDNATVTGDYVRQDSYTRYIVPALNRSNLHVVDRATVVKVSGDRDCRSRRQRTPCVNTVTYFRDDEMVQVRVKKGGEIVLSAGALETPKILMHSGIGSCQELAAFGIACVKNIPLMAKRIQEHIAFSTIHLVLKISPDWVNHRGSLTSTYTSSRADGLINLELTATGLPVAGAGHLLINQPVVTRVESYGQITLKDADWLSPVNISFGIFTNDSDRDALLYAFRRVNEAIEATKIACACTILSTSATLPPATATDTQVKTWLKDAAVSDYHTVASTPMGSCDQGATVDDELRVCGVTGLRVADNGVMPFAYTAHSTHAGALIIGEQVARFITML